MLCSVGYHLFSCHRSEKTSRRWLALDYAGISVGILGCYVPGIFYAFYCNAVSVNSHSLKLIAAHCLFLGSNLKSRLIFIPRAAVLATGLPADSPVLDPGRLLRSGPPQLPQQRLAAHTDDHLLLRGRHQRGPCLPLGLAQRRFRLRRGAGEETCAQTALCSASGCIVLTLGFPGCAALPAPRDSDVPDRWICLPVLRHQNP